MNPDGVCNLLAIKRVDVELKVSNPLLRLGLGLGLGPGSGLGLGLGLHLKLQVNSPFLQFRPGLGQVRPGLGLRIRVLVVIECKTRSG